MMSVFERDTGKLEITDDERWWHLHSEIAKLESENAKLEAVLDAAKAVDISFQCSDDIGSYREIDADLTIGLELQG